MQQSLMGAGNWQDLIGFYTEILKDETCNDIPKKFEPNGNMGLNREEHNVQDFAPCKTSNWLPQNLNPTGIVGMNFGEHINIQDYAQIEKLRSLNQNAASVGSNLQNIGDVVPPPKVNPLAKLMGMKSSLCVPQTNGVPDRSTYVMGKPNITNSSQVESRYRNCESNSATLQQNRILHANQGIGGHHLQQIPNNRLPVPYWHNYNLNFLQRSEAGEFSTLDRPRQLGPVTPDQLKQSKKYQISQVPHVLIDEISTEANDKHENVVLSQRPETAESNHDKYLHNKLRPSSAAILQLPEEKNYSNGGDVGRIDLNKTPLQKTPKRRKHRPKVIVEGKPKRTPKSAAAKNNTPNGPSRKRKYVRKSSIETSTQLTDVANDVNVSNVEPAAKSCRRALNFPVENGVEMKSYSREFDYQALNNEGSKASTLNLDSKNAGKSTELNRPSTSTVKEGHQNTNGEEKQLTKNSYNSVNSINKIHPQESLPPAPTAQARTSKDHALNVIARSLNARNANIKQSVGQNRYGPIHHHINGVAHFVIQGNTKEQNFYRMQPMLQSGAHLLEHMVSVTEKQGSTRECSHTELTHPQTVTLKGSQLWSHGVYKTTHYNNHNSKILKNASESSIEATRMPSDTTLIEDCLGLIESRENKSFHAQSSALHLDGGLPNSDSKGERTSTYSKSEANKVVCDQDVNSTEFRIKFQQQHNPSHEHLLSEQMAQKASPQFAKMQSINSLSTANYCNLGSASQSDPKFTQGDEIINYPACVLENRQTAEPISSKHLSSIDKVCRQETRSSRVYEHLSKEVTGSGEKGDLILVDHITARMKDLNINNNGKKIVRTKQSALVPYRGDGAIVPYEAFDPIKKRRPRPKVDLDPETNRLWNLLLSKEESEGVETMNTDRQRWWEEERKVFRGRVDSFIARMHLVQGDRRFSKWKGSVVDSVIGVFLTQNVSDHLSSSAFITLAAKFPLKSATIKQKCPKNGECPVKHEVRITFPDGATVSDHRMIKEQMYDNSLEASSALSKDREDNVITGTRTDLRNDNTRRTEQNTISSKSSSESFIFQASEVIRASAGSKSEYEDQITGRDFRKIHNPPSFSEQSERIAAFQQYQFQIMERSFQHQRPFISHQQLENLAVRHIPRLANSRNAYAYPFTSNVPHHQSPVPLSSNSRPNTSKGLEKWKSYVLELLGKESTSSLALTDFKTPHGMGGEHVCDNAEKGRVESSFIDQQIGKVKFQPLTENCAVPNKHMEQQADFPAVPQSKNVQHIKHGQGGIQETFQKESTFRTDPIRPAEAFSKTPSGNQKPSGNTTHEPIEMKQKKSSSEPSSEIRETSNARKRKAEKEKTEPFIWDTLRKEVQLKVGTIGRSRDPMDSLDYDALQKADVREISETIKQRGMNNMLAQRIKDFLDRLVRDHEKIDLEWLRDVPPHKAKDYLLSIRGLGLKSVECVRLLTLHHLAFPVDTNVGRIAVRLGWVPLQPLPESLQLHLLELYPVLESIQKYLWPRLCKLDQETLYELHYQMITFGKVFCTKREPNCNACPMRGECRHFASAFTSARLALPGPEERRVVCSATPINDKKSSDVTIYPLSLLPVEDNLEKEMGLMRNFEPIIEEPTTPEPHIEMSDRDIEDTFYEDPDEIPVIKLNIEEFTTNLQNFMKGQMEMQEGDMSKAMVALSPRLASIPMPKLKHVGRLRTEHQVYELPDSHPLLKELDRREPDDPSPYLLAIWTPGETADSVRPPESPCSSREGGGLCNKDTCLPCNSIREMQAQTVRGTILIPCRTAMRGSFPLNGTYFQVNEVFADHESSMNPIDVPRSLLWNLPRRTVFFGTSVSTIFKGMSTEDIQYSFWKGFVCVRAFDQKLRAPRPLTGRLHQSAYKVVKQNEKRQSNAA